MYYLHAMPRTLSAFYIYRMIAAHIHNYRTKIDLLCEFTSPFCQVSCQNVYFVIIQAITAKGFSGRTYIQIYIILAKPATFRETGKAFGYRLGRRGRRRLPPGITLIGKGLVNGAGLDNSGLIEAV